MHIFIDESGTFQVPLSRPNSVSCVAALIVPESFAATLYRKFTRLVRPWIRKGEQEIKGSNLDESQVAAVLALLRRFDVLVFATCIDMALHTDERIAFHKNRQADELVKRVEEASPGLRRDLEDFAATMRALPNQLYAQSVVLTELVHKVLQIGTLYYVQRIPRTLGRFKWRVDAKGIEMTKYEKLWQEIVLGLLQTKSLEDPLIQLEGADYRTFARFNNETADEPPPHLRARLPTGKRFLSSDLRLLLREDLKFTASHRYAGLQVVDVVANAIQRACNGRLRVEGWGEVGRLMPRAEKGKSTLRFISLMEPLPPGSTTSAPPYVAVARRCAEKAKNVVAGT